MRCGAEPLVRLLGSNVLVANGNEVFDLTFSGPGPTAVSVLIIPNVFTGPTVSLFDLLDTPIGSFTLLDLGAVRFLGITSRVPIGRIHYEAVGGHIQNAGLDDVSVGAVISAVPEPATLWLLAGGLAAALGARARRRR